MKEEGNVLYHKDRWIILIVLVLLIALLINFADKDVRTLLFDKKVITGLVGGLFGLLTRNLIFMSGSISETPGKKLGWSYLAYALFVAASSLLIFGIFSIYQRDIAPHLFYAFLVPLNFYVGLLTYSVFQIIKKTFDLLEKALSVVLSNK